jgi:hypothetical protein
MEMRDFVGEMLREGDSIKPTVVEEDDGWHLRLDWGYGSRVSEDAFDTAMEAALAGVDWLSDEVGIDFDQFLQSH